MKQAWIEHAPTVSLLTYVTIADAMVNYAFTHVRNKNSNIQGISPIVVKLIFHTIIKVQFKTFFCIFTK